MKDAKLNSRAIAIEPLVKLAQVNGVAFSGCSAAFAALDQDRRVEDQHDQELQADQDREDLDRKIDLAVAQHRDDRHGDEGVDPPRQVDTEILAEEAGGGRGEQTVQPDLHGVVAEQGDQSRRRRPRVASVRGRQSYRRLRCWCGGGPSRCSRRRRSARSD